MYLFESSQSNWWVQIPQGPPSFSERTIGGARQWWIVKRKRERVLRLALVLLVLGVAAALPMPSLFAPNAEGATTNKIVYGIVYDRADQSIPGADVVVEIWGGDWPVQEFFRTSDSTVSDASGHYEVTISSNYWDPHNTIKVIVTYDSIQESDKFEADAEEYQEHDMFMNLEIPEFNSSHGFLAIMAGCMILMVILLKRKRR